MDKDREKTSGHTPSFDEYIEELHEDGFMPMPPAATELGRRAVTHPEAVIELRVVEDGTPDAPYRSHIEE